MSAATLEREAGDDRDPQVEIAKLREMYDAPSVPEPGPGDIQIMHAGQITGHLLLRRYNARFN